jgi:hypothetical protein
MNFGLFEQYPLLLVAFIIVTVELWNLVKTFVLKQIFSRQKQQGSG